MTLHSLDIWKAFDMVEWEEVIVGLQKMGADGDLVRAIGRELKGHTLEFGLSAGLVHIAKRGGLIQGRPESTDVALAVITSILRPLREKLRAKHGAQSAGAERTHPRHRKPARA